MTIGRQLSDGNADGTSLGQSVTDKISVFGKTPVAQQSATLSAAITSGATLAALAPAFIELYTAMKTFGFVS